MLRLVSRPRVSLRIPHIVNKTIHAQVIISVHALYVVVVVIVVFPLYVRILGARSSAGD